MSIQISGSNLTTGFNNTVKSPPYGSLSFNGLNQSVVTSGTGSAAPRHPTPQDSVFEYRWFQIDPTQIINPLFSFYVP